MSNSKKIQQEIDRQLRRTQEGIESYEELYNKFLKSNTQSQKERLEGELKREIKKLQRFRDAIKAFIANPEVKDTKMLESFQKNIEEKMETFKACERETKTKAFSKEGLAASAPNEGPQAHIESWLKSAMEDARKQIEIIEYDVEHNPRGHHGRGKNAVAASAARLQKLKFHLGKLEQLLKAVTNGDADLDEVGSIKEHVQRFLNNETGSEEEDDYDEETLYSGFDLDEIEQENRQSGSGALADEDNTNNNNTTTTTTGQELLKKTTSAAAAGATSPTPTKSINQTAAAKKTPPSANIIKTESTKRQANSPIPTTKSPGISTSNNNSNNTMSAATAKLNPTRDPAPESWEEAAELLDDEMDKANDDTFGDDAMEMAGPGSLADMAKLTGGLSRLGDWEKGRPASLTSPPSATNTNNNNTNINIINKSQSVEQQTQVQGQIQSPTTTTASATAVTPTTTTTATANNNNNNTTTMSAQQQQKTDSKQRTSGASPVTSTSHVAPTYDKAMMLQLVDMSLANLPHTQDVDRQRPFEPTNPITCPSYYPDQVLPAFASPDIYREFEQETLFFIFYYHQNTYQQYYAAKQIKAHSYRYHKELNTWFVQRKRTNEPQENCVRGSFTYFDYEGAWKFEEKEDFTFNYQYMEDELR